MRLTLTTLEERVHRTPWTEAHDDLLAAAEPPVAEPTADEVEQGWARIAARIETSTERPTRRRSGLRTGVVAGIGVVLLASSGLAVADHYTARTGKGPVDAEDLRLGGPGEKLALVAPDYGAVIAEETTDIPFPTAESRAIALRDQVDDTRGATTDEFVSTGAVRAWVAAAALCSWSNQWAAATRSGDEAARAEAIGQIQAAPDWPAISAIDPAPYRRIESQKVRDDDGSVRTEHYWDESQYYYLEALGEAVDGDDVGAVARLLAQHNGYCRGPLVPDIPNADPMRARAHGER